MLFSSVNRSLLRVAAWFCVLPALEISAGETATQKLAFFESKIRPVLVEKCYGCHSAEAKAKGKLKGGLYLDTREGLLAGGDTGPAIIAGNPSKSLVIQAIRHASEDVAMPPRGEKLSDAVIADFALWIKDGAADPRDGAAPVAKKRGLSLEEGRKLWSLIAPKPTLQKAERGTRSAEKTDIDRLVRAKLEEQHLAPVAEADARSLVRRLTFDLVGLPPSPEEVEQFVREVAEDKERGREGEGEKNTKSEVSLSPSLPLSLSSPQAGKALEALVDRLLASPRFGERWGRHWLDAARYADSNGRDRNIMNYHAWRYRDYVIEAFNRDKPYDQFVREQIAGDLMPAKDPAEQDEQRIATAFLALGSKAFEEFKPEVFRMDVIDEQIEVIGRSVLGLSIGCARCHDHKFDPIPTADYYALAGILRSTQPLYGWGPRGIKASTYLHTEWQPIGPEAEKLAPAALDYYRRLDAEILSLHTARSTRYGVQRRLSSAKLEMEKSAAKKEKLTAEIARMEGEMKEWDVKIRGMEAGVESLKDAAPPEPGWTMAARDREKIEDCRIHIRGDTTNLGNPVPRGMLQVIALSDVPAPDAKQSGRWQLAQWLTHRDNPLTARVFVNRVWQKLFGRALVTTLDDFGVNGAKPSHPELLDELAVRFMEHGWSVKQLIRELVLTRTYRLSTDANAENLARDPDNVFLWRMSPRPVEAEALRDAILAVSGQLDPNPPTSQFLDRYHSRRDAELSTFKPFLTSADLVDNHRSVYLPVVRGALPEIFQVFDFAAPERPVAQREESIVPAQSLYLMNNPWVIEQAAQTARRLLADSGDADAERIARLYLLAFARPPLPEETSRAQAFLAGNDVLLPVAISKTARPASGPREARWTSFCQSIFAAAEFRVIR